MLRVLTHSRAALRIAQKFNPSDARVFGAFHLDGRVRGDEAAGNLRKIFHGRPEHGNFAERRWLENIVPAGGHQGATYKRAVGQTIERCEFPDAIQENHRNIARYRTIAGGRRALRVTW